MIGDNASVQAKAHDFKRFGLNHADDGKAPRCTQSRPDGPPLLFKTDARTTVLAHIAIAGGPTRSMVLSEHLRRTHSKSMYTILLTKLASEGLISKWTLPALPGERACRVYYDLNPAYPGAPELRALLCRIAAVYPGFSRVPYHPDNATAGVAPLQLADRKVYQGGRYTIEYALGDKLRTNVLLGIFVMGRARTSDLCHGATSHGPKRVSAALYMFEASGILRIVRYGPTGGAGTFFELNDAHILYPELRAYLMALDQYYPAARVKMDAQMKSKRLNNFTNRRCTRASQAWRLIRLPL